jgi:hypothetical protein
VLKVHADELNQEPQAKLCGHSVKIVGDARAVSQPPFPLEPSSDKVDLAERRPQRILLVRDLAHCDASRTYSTLIGAVSKL